MSVCAFQNAFHNTFIDSNNQRYTQVTVLCFWNALPVSPDMWTWHCFWGEWTLCELEWSVLLLAGSSATHLWARHSVPLFLMCPLIEELIHQPCRSPHTVATFVAAPPLTHGLTGSQRTHSERSAVWWWRGCVCVYVCMCVYLSVSVCVCVPLYICVCYSSLIRFTKIILYAAHTPM